MATPLEKLQQLKQEEAEVKARLEYITLEVQGLLETLARLVPYTLRSIDEWASWYNLFKSTVSRIGYILTVGGTEPENLRDLIEKLYWTQRGIKHLEETVEREETRGEKG